MSCSFTSSSMIPGNFLVVSLGFSVCAAAYLLQAVAVYLFHFKFGLLFFLLLLWLLWLGLPALCWIKLVRAWILVWFLTIEKVLSAFHLEHDFSRGLSTPGLYYVEVFSLYTHVLWEFLNHKWMLKFIKIFLLHLLRWSNGFYSSVC